MRSSWPGRGARHAGISEPDFLTEMSIGEAFSQAFHVVYRSEKGMNFVGLELLAAIVVAMLAGIT